MFGCPCDKNNAVCTAIHYYRTPRDESHRWVPGNDLAAFIQHEVSICCPAGAEAAHPRATTSRSASETARIDDEAEKHRVPVRARPGSRPPNMKPRYGILRFAAACSVFGCSEMNPRLNRVSDKHTQTHTQREKENEIERERSDGAGIGHSVRFAWRVSFVGWPTTAKRRLWGTPRPA